MMRAGDPVAVFDAHASRWTRAEVVSLNATRTRALVAGDTWWALLPLAPKYVRPIAVVRAS